MHLVKLSWLVKAKNDKVSEMVVYNDRSVYFDYQQTTGGSLVITYSQVDRSLEL